MFNPGVVTAMSRRGNLAFAASAKLLTAAALPASATIASAAPPFSRILAAVASAPPPSRSAQTTRAPRPASASAEDLPMPDAAPSTTAIFPVRSKSLRVSGIALLRLLAQSRDHPAQHRCRLKIDEHAQAREQSRRPAQYAAEN